MTYIPDSGQSVQSTANTNSNIIIGGQTTLAADITNSDTTITLATGTGSNFPTSDSIIQIGSEIIKYSSRVGDVLTVAGSYGERGAYNTTATSHTTGATINGVWTTEGELNGYPAAITSTRMDVTYTLYYDFSNDGTIWTTYPSSGFTGAINIHEFHQAIKAGRYFRPRILNTSASASSSSWHYTYYGQFSDGKLPLNQLIGNDQDSIITRSVIVGENDSGTFTNVLTTNNNELRVNIGERDLFGINISKQIIPLVQSYQLYGIKSHSQLYEQFTASGGTITATADGTGVNLNISTTSGSYSTLRSKRVLKYRSGYSLLCRSGFKFDTPVTGSLQFTGVGNAQSDLYFCYNGTDFGIRRSTGGQLHVVKLTIDTAASGAETATVTLNGVEFSGISLTAAGAAGTSFTAHQIEIHGYTGWNVEHVGSDIYFIASSVGARNGTYSFTNNTVGGTAASTSGFSQIKAGSGLTTDFVAQSSWNGWSDMITSLDPTQNNMYQILYSWYGVGNIIFSIYNPSTSRYETVHTLTFANTETNPSLTSPNMYIQRGVASLGSTTAMTAKSYGSFGGIIGNIDKSIGPKSSVSNTKTSITTEKIVLAVKNRFIINGYSNQSEAFLKSISASTEGTKNVVFKVYKNPSSLGTNSVDDYTNYSYVEESESLLLLDTTVGTFSGGDILFTFTLAKADSRYFDISERGIFLGREDVLIVTATSTSATEATVSLAFEEDY